MWFGVWQDRFWGLGREAERGEVVKGEAERREAERGEVVKGEDRKSVV